jgi:hypothetical protein
MLRAVDSTAIESVFGHSPSNTFCMEVVSELATEFQKMEDRHSRIERPTMRICYLLLGSASYLARLADHLDKATRHGRRCMQS